MEGTVKLVDFTFCNTCQNKDTYENDEPCNTCLRCSARENSVKPINYKEEKK